MEKNEFKKRNFKERDEWISTYPGTTKRPSSTFANVAMTA